MSMEDKDGLDGSPAKSLGKLQFSLDYDFQKGEVLNITMKSTLYMINASVAIIIECGMSILY